VNTLVATLAAVRGLHDYDAAIVVHASGGEPPAGEQPSGGVAPPPEPTIALPAPSPSKRPSRSPSRKPSQSPAAPTPALFAEQPPQPTSDTGESPVAEPPSAPSPVSTPPPLRDGRDANSGKSDRRQTLPSRVLTMNVAAGDAGVASGQLARGHVLLVGFVVAFGACVAVARRCSATRSASSVVGRASSPADNGDGGGRTSGHATELTAVATGAAAGGASGGADAVHLRRHGGHANV
jgi:hypothetical protein